jgi:hypothetical protein
LRVFSGSVLAADTDPYIYIETVMINPLGEIRRATAVMFRHTYQWRHISEPLRLAARIVFLLVPNEIKAEREHLLESEKSSIFGHFFCNLIVYFLFLCSSLF